MAKSTNPFRYFDSSPEVIRLVVMMYVKYPLSLRNVADLLAESAVRLTAVGHNSPYPHLLTRLPPPTPHRLRRGSGGGWVG